MDPDAPPAPPEEPKPDTSKSKLGIPHPKEVESHSVEDLGDISSEFSVEVGLVLFVNSKYIQLRGATRLYSSRQEQFDITHVGVGLEFKTRRACV